jgi:predicted N-acyltransferase
MSGSAVQLIRNDYRTRLAPDLAGIGREQWDGLLAASVAATAPDAAPDAATGARTEYAAPGPLPAFLRFDFLEALERTGCVGADTGWQPLHMTLWRGHELVGAAPLYAKGHSYGEYVFDWAWADAYQRHGLRYYPKLLCAVPFTPVAGPRLLAVDEPAREALMLALLAQARESRLSSLHLLFPCEADARRAEDTGMMIRRGVQFHWRNAGYDNFEQFLSTLSQPKRKKIRAERRKVADAGVRFRRLVGREIGEADWALFSACYEATYAAHGGVPYLNREFFLTIAQRIPEHLVMIVASRDARPIAASLLVRDAHRMYGRYWGTLERIDCLHFETAFYQSIEAAIDLRVEVLEGGAQGEHKMSRGFLPEPTCSAHWLAEPAFADAVDRFLAREGTLIEGYLDELRERTPFRKA